MGLKLVYITLRPGEYPRVRKIGSTLRSQNVTFRALVPKIRIKLGNRKVERIVSASITYTIFLLQVFLADADVYWVANAPEIFVLPLILKREKYILDYRSPWPLAIRFEFGKGLLSYIAQSLTYVALKYSRLVTLASSTLWEDVKKFGKKVYVIPNYPQKDDFQPTVSYEHFRKLHGIQKNEKVILFVGNLSKVEGVDILPEIVKGLLGKRERISFWIIGDGVLRSVVQQLEKEFPENVKFFGWRPHRGIPDFVNAADVCIVPRHETAFSHYANEEGVQKISEYMFLGKPIVACGVAPSKEYLLVKRQDIVKGILEALDGKAPKPRRRTWEDDCKKIVLEVVNSIKTVLN